MQGKVKWFDNGRGIGMIETEKGEEVTFNRIAVENAGRVSLRAKESVEFEIRKVRNWEGAINLHVLS
jgi:cold shock CspA family protein